MVADALVVDTGSANLASVGAALRRAGVTPTISADAEAVRRARRVVLPGVGAFGAVMTRLRENGLAEALRERIMAGGSLLAICLGMQLLAESSEEDAGITGLAIFDARVRRLDGALRIPQLGWNLVTPDAGATSVSSGFAYFANSFAISDAPTGWTASRSEYGAPFIAAVERGNQLACQFHPELSGAWGADLIQRWINRC
jgi:glutamine amidotransferase